MKKKSKNAKPIKLVKYRASKFAVVSQSDDGEWSYDLAGFETLDAAKSCFEHEKQQANKDVAEGNERCIFWTRPIMLVAVLESVEPPE